MKRNKFSLSHDNNLTADMGELVPIANLEVLPGDSIQHATSLLIRLSPLLAPVMHRVNVRIHHFYVPHRIIWEDFEDFITGGPDGMNASVYPTVQLKWNGTPAAGQPQSGELGNLADYLGAPPGFDQLEVSALPFRAYAEIFNKWYRDQDLVAELPVSHASGLDTTTNTDLVNVAWGRDYFTTARPFAQKGPEVSLPLTGDAPVTGPAVNDFYSIIDSGGTPRATRDGGAGAHLSSITQPTADAPLVADLSNVTAATARDLRVVLALQRYQEARAMYGSRYTEYLRYLGIRSSDARLQNPELLGSGRQVIQFSEVLSTADTGGTPVGALKGHGIAAVRSNRYRRHFEEHGTILTCLSILPKTIYPQAVAKHWLRRTKEDFWQKELEHVGQEAIAAVELYAGAADPAKVFGYQDRYESYREQFGRVTGEFRDTTLDFWHMARIFASEPELNADFVTSNPTKRIFAEQTQDALWMKALHSIQARRLVAGSGKAFVL